jgi:hypothetical protein
MNQKKTDFPGWQPHSLDVMSHQDSANAACDSLSAWQTSYQCLLFYELCVASVWVGSFADCICGTAILFKFLFQ